MVCIADIDKEVYIMADWLIRALKTFVQAFFGVLIPELCVILITHNLRDSIRQKLTAVYRLG